MPGSICQPASDISSDRMFYSNGSVVNFTLESQGGIQVARMHCPVVRDNMTQRWQRLFIRVSAARCEIQCTECRSTVCRVDVEFSDARAELEGIPFLPTLIPWSGESYVQTDPTGEGNTAVLFVAREGFSLAGEPQNTDE